MAYRFDTGRIVKYEDTDDGFLRAYFRFRKLGDLEYINPDGSKRVETVTADELYKRASLRTAALKPITHNHPPTGIVTPGNAKHYQKGMTGNTIVRDDPYAMIVGVVTDEETIDAIKSGKLPDVSSGYWSQTVNTDGRLLQTNVKYNHFAGCENGRAGPDVGFLGIKVDSVDSDIGFQLIDPESLNPNKPIVWTPFNFDSVEFGAKKLAQPSYPDPELVADNFKNTAGLIFPASPPLKTEPLAKQDTGMTITQIRIDDKTTISVGTNQSEQILAGYLRDTLDVLEKDRAKITTLQEKADKVDKLDSDLQAAYKERDQEKARADVASTKLIEVEKLIADDNTIKCAFDSGYQRHVLEVTAVKFLPTEVKIDSSQSDKDIKLAVIKHQLKLKADSDESKRYDAQSEAYIDAAYDLITKSDSSTRLLVTAASARPEEKQDAAEMARARYIERLKNRNKQQVEATK